MTDEHEGRGLETLEQWGRALDAAAALLLMDRLRSPAGDPERGMFPHDDALERYVLERARLGIASDQERDLRGLPPR
ncbi:MAG: hypothetical protein M3P49_04825 [Actinomycetota bacterium]|nr:hypothetical protein [Actinomycetota bacterium]